VVLVSAPPIHKKNQDCYSTSDTLEYFSVLSESYMFYL
jgi:hypothetical protein